MAFPIRLDHRGIGEQMKSPEMLGAIRTVTEGVAARLRGLEPNYPVAADVTTTDRAHGRVTISHPAGAAVQAKRGSLTKAAAAAGLEVKPR
jgi:hypothetical protein